MKKKTQKWYVVWEGREIGVFTSWKECEKQVKGYKGAKYKSFESEDAAFRAFFGEKINASAERKNNSNKKAAKHKDYIPDSISTDASCSGNPGVLRFRGVETKTGKILFEYGPFPVGTNNIGEFLAIVHALKYLNKKKNYRKPIYADSQSAIAWVKNKKVNTNLERNEKTEPLWKMIDEAVSWLKNNEYQNPILKWNTQEWGEIRADYGKKN